MFNPIKQYRQWKETQKWAKKFPNLVGVDWVADAKYNPEDHRGVPQTVKHWCPTHGWEPYVNNGQALPQPQLPIGIIIISPHKQYE